MRLVQLDVFRKEIEEFPVETREEIFSLVDRYLKGERMNQTDFKTFKIDRKTKIQEFKVKDHRGNWRAISFILKGDDLVFVYAFHKKSQGLLQKDKEIIKSRVSRVRL